MVHGRDAEHHGGAVAQSRGRCRGVEPAEVAERATSTQGTEQPDHKPVDMEQRQPVDDDVITGPVPGVGERVEVGGERPLRQDRALGATGGPRRVDDQRRIVVRGGGVRQLAPTGADVDREATERVRERRHGLIRGADQHVGLAVGEDVQQLRTAELGVDRDQRGAHAHHGHGGYTELERRLGPDGDATRPVEPGRDDGGGFAQLSIGERGTRHRHGRLGIELSDSGEHRLR